MEVRFRSRLKLVCAASLVPVVLVIAFGFGGVVWFNYGNPENTCATCHEEVSHVQSWKTSFHRGLHCRNCHGSSLTLNFHALEEHANRIARHFQMSPEQAPPKLNEIQVLALQEACRKCHPSTFADWQSGHHSVTYSNIFLDPKHNRTEQLAADCLRCHGMFYDNRIADLVTPLSKTGPWTFNDATKAGQPVIPCLACHQIHASATTYPPVQLYNRHEQAWIPDELLPQTPIIRDGQPMKLSTDPRQRLCTQCHAPNAFRQLGSQDDRTPFGVHAGLSCLDCHSPHSTSARSSCAACHPADSHCGIDVEKMDTTYVSKTSPHNIHFVTCGDCHHGRRPPGRGTAAGPPARSGALLSVDHPTSAVAPPTASIRRIALDGTEGVPAPAVEQGQDGIDRIHAVPTPMLELFPSAQKRSRGTILLCPGGGYYLLAINHEGYYVADKLNQLGFDTAILLYHVNAGGSTRDLALTDARLALKSVRQHGPQWGLSTNRIGLMGFSAGGHLVARLAHLETADAAPDFMVLMYPAFLEQDGKLSDEVAPVKAPVFLYVAADDPFAASGSIAFAGACQARHVPCDFIRTEHGGHGFGLKLPLPPDVQDWPERLAAFLDSLK